MSQERCRCGNLTPLGELKDGLCLACTREKKERQEAEAELQHLIELQTRFSVFGGPNG